LKRVRHASSCSTRSPRRRACRAIIWRGRSRRPHSDHISAIPATHYTIWNKWLPESEHEAADGISFELYDKRFDPQTGMGGVEIWIPVKT
jgi:hypothetical protein